MLHAAGDTAAVGAAMTHGAPEYSSDDLLEDVLHTLDDNKAEEVVPIGLRGKSELADHMIVASGRSTRQVVSIADKITERLKERFRITCKVEGREAGDWVLIDAGDVIVHLFRPEVRTFYQLEKMWQSSGAETAPA